MRLYLMVLFCLVLATTTADPDPKKYKSEVKDKNKQSNATLTADEKKFLREVEEKYGINGGTKEALKEENKNANEEKSKAPQPGIPSFPAVIAIEIVNDTEKSKGKRTIDANLGYGYKTNNGYTYSYFGKPAQEKGKFMIYPYSQEDIPPVNTHSYNHYDQSGNNVKTSVEIQTSQAFELVPVKEEKPAYNYEKPAVEFNTPSPQPASYSSSEQSSNSHSSHPSTLYTTYNGEQFSGLSGQFPTVMPDYLVDPTQLIKNPEYQNVGLTQDHLRTPGSHLEQKVVPVLVLRIPSSSLNNPTAELYANLPQNYPLSNYLNHLNLQELVNQYFKKAGYRFAPQVMAYPSSHSLESHGQESYSQESYSQGGHGQSGSSQYEPQHYAHPYVQPSYTQADLSAGVQYSAVQPVMARYPSSYVRHQYMTMPKGYSIYKQPSQPQRPEYQYQYVPQSQAAVSSQKFYMPSSHYQQETEHVTSQEIQGDHQASLNQGAGAQYTSGQVQYEEPAQVSAGYENAVTPGVEYRTPGAEYGTPGVEYGTPAPHAEAEYEHSNTVAPQYGSQEQYSQSVSAGYESAITAAPAYGSAKESAVSHISNEYYTQIQHDQPDTQSIYQSQNLQSSQASQSDEGGQPNYVYEQQEHQSDDQGLILSENYPSKDHTVATVLPTHYKGGKQNSGAIQTVSYVTPMPHSKYQLPYKVMVPQTFLHNPSTEKVAYVNSHPVSSSYSQSVLQQDYNPEAEYTIGYRHVPPVGKQKPPSFPRNYHSHPKRMAKPENKPGASPSPFSKNKNERNEKKRLS